MMRSTGAVGSDPPTVTGLASSCRETAASLAAQTVDVRTAPDDALVETIRSLEAAQRALDSARLSVIGELDARSEPERRTGLRTPGWLGLEFCWPRPAAGRCVATARKLRTRLPLVAAALRDGTITLAHAELLARLCNDRVEPIVVDLQETLIGLAADVRFEQWATEVRALIDVADTDGGHDPRPENNRLSLADGLSGELHLEITLVGADAAATRAALLAELERRFDHHRRLANQDPGHDRPGRSQLLADGFAELIRRGVAAGPSTSAPVTDVTLVIQASDPVHAFTPDGVLLQDDSTRLLLCDAALTAVIVDGLGVPLDMGTAVRFFTPGQRRAIRVRDGGCVFPGCDAPVWWTQIHHLDEAVADDGPSDLANGVPLCPIDHAKVHEGDWTLEPDDQAHDHGVVFISPTGRRLRSHRHGRPRPAAPSS